jgi:hypothetical protein
MLLFQGQSIYHDNVLCISSELFLFQWRHYDFLNSFAHCSTILAYIDNCTIFIAFYKRDHDHALYISNYSINIPDKTRFTNKYISTHTVKLFCLKHGEVAFLDIPRYYISIYLENVFLVEFLKCVVILHPDKEHFLIYTESRPNHFLFQIEILTFYYLSFPLL